MKHLFMLLMVLLFPVFSSAQQYEEAGTCSYYADRVHGHGTSSGERYDKYLYTAAHRTLPFNTLVRVTNIKNNKSVVVRIIDRGPYSKDRILDVSKAAARDLGMLSEGVIWVTIETVGMADADSVRAFLEERKKELAARRPQKTKAKPVVIKTSDGLLPGKFYDQDLVVCTPMGYGIQVGYYKSLSNCRSTMHSYQAKYETTIYIHAESKKNTIYYKLVLGQFANNKSASDFRDKIIKDIPSCFIIAYKDL